MNRLLVIVLSALLMVTLAGWQGGPAQATGGGTTTTVEITGPNMATVGVETILTAQVMPPDAGGTVQFTNGNVGLGDPVAVDEHGLASLTYTFSSEGSQTLGAAFTPPASSEFDPSVDPDGWYLTVVPASVPGTEMGVTGPLSAIVGVPTQVTAQVSPAEAEGTVVFSVDEDPLGPPVAVDGGVASLPYTFPSAGVVTIWAAFTPEDPEAYGESETVSGWDVTVSPASVPDPEPEATTTAVSAPATATVGTPVTLGTSVSPAVAGTVQFSVGGALVGSPVNVTAGAASVSYTFASAGVSTVQATFTPELSFAYTGSTGSASVTAVADPDPTTIEVTGPDVAKVGEEATLTATVLPAEASGQVTFYVNDEQVATVAVDAGAASTPYTFESDGESSVVAFFEPTDADTYQSSSSSPHTFGVEPGTTSESESDSVSEADISADTGCAKVGRAPGEGTVLRRGGPIENFFTGLIVQVAGWFYNGLTFISTVITTLANTIAQIFHVGPYVGCKTAGGRHRAATTVTTTVQCVLTDAGYWCPINVPAGSRVSMEGSIPMPAELAGKLVKLETTMSSVDPITGELTTVGSGTTRVHVPKRTVLSARLSPVKQGLTSVQRGQSVAYRVTVGNAGVVTANGVRTCVSLGKGAKVVNAKGADVRGRQACWTVPTLKGDKSVSKTLTLRAPSKVGPLKIIANVTPKKTQAGPVRLNSVLNVR